MPLVLAIVQAFLGALVLRFSIGILDSGNSKNEWGMALFLGFGLTMLGLGGLTGSLLGLICLLYLLINYYDLGMVKAFLVGGIYIATFMALGVVLRTILG